MKIKLTKINVAKNTKEDKNGKKYKTCGIESPDLQYVYFHNIYEQTDPVSNWKVGDQVDVELTDNGQWHNFGPIKAYAPSSKGNYQPKMATQSVPAAKADQSTDLTQIKAELDGIRSRLTDVEGAINDIRNETNPL
jgi:hypothetical protein